MDDTQRRCARHGRERPIELPSASRRAPLAASSRACGAHVGDAPVCLLWLAVPALYVRHGAGGVTTGYCCAASAQRLTSRRCRRMVGTYMREYRKQHTILLKDAEMYDT
jgi:hypothetical protein